MCYYPNKYHVMFYPEEFFEEETQDGGEATIDKLIEYLQHIKETRPGYKLLQVSEGGLLFAEKMRKDWGY